MATAEDIQRLIINHTRRLQKLEERQALQGVSTDPAVSIEIEDIRAKIGSLKTEAQAIWDEGVPFSELDYHYNRAVEIVRSDPLDRRYELVELIGMSHYGQIWKVHDIILDHQCAILISPAIDENYTRAFLHEAKLLRILRHPNIMRMYDFSKFIVNDRPAICIVMDFAEQGSLESLIRSRKLPAREIIDIFFQICSAVGYLHAQNPRIVHRNLRSSNILFDRQGGVLISGLGMNMGRTDLDILSPSSIDYPKTAYMAPEIFTRREIGLQVDIFSLGIILHETLTGILLRRDLLTGKFVTPIANSLSLDVQNVIDKSTNIDPRQRYQSVGEFHDSISYALGQQNASDRSKSVLSRLRSFLRR